MISEFLITKSDIEDIIGTLDINKAVGHDLISHKLLKMFGLLSPHPFVCNSINH